MHMSLAIIASQALAGMKTLPVHVEVHVGAGLPGFNIVGLPNTGVRESRDRVRSAIVNSGYEFPSGRVTVNLAPADLPKNSGRFDLPIALGVLLASGQIPITDSSSASNIAQYVIAGELSLTGAVMPVSAPLLLSMGAAGCNNNIKIILPASVAGLAAMVPGVTVLQASFLYEVVNHFAGIKLLDPAMPAPANNINTNIACMSDVRGQAIAKRAMEIAATGGHNMLMTSPPGTGKSMLAHRLPGILPSLSKQHALEVAAVHSVANLDRIEISYIPPFRAPHHSVSVPALVGGGYIPKPGEISYAHRGVLFLDELLEFSRSSVEALREPLETGQITIARSHHTSVFLADFQLLAAMNPCPCGWLGHTINSCTCTPEQISRYRSKISGPFLDRIDLQVTLQANKSGWLTQTASEPSVQIKSRVVQARQIQLQRQGCLNAKLNVAELDKYCFLSQSTISLLEQAIDSWGWSSRAVHRLIKVARTIADMSHATNIKSDHISEAIQYKSFN